MRVSVRNFFTNYITNCFSKDLSYKDRIKCLAISILLAPITFGIAHLVGYFWRKHTIAQLSIKNRIYEDTQKRYKNAVKKADAVFKATISKSSPLHITQAQMPKIAEDIFTFYYAKPFPREEDATVVFDGKTVKWKSLSHKDKITVLKEFGKLNGVVSTWMPDQLFYGSTTKQIYLQNDPRESHGKDHAMRTTLFALAFAYLYSKYQKIELSHKDLVQIQMAALLHDSGRNTDGVDLWENQSAINAENFLEKKTQFLEEKTLRPDDIKTISEAIRTQDGTLAGKCLQNADSVEYVRLVIEAPEQESAGFEESRKFLKIADDAEENKNFLEELDAIRYEMNQLIWETCQKTVREEIANSKNYYEAFLKKINIASYPSLHYILSQLDVIKPTQSSEVEELPSAVALSSQTIKDRKHDRVRNLDDKIMDLLENKELNKAALKLIEAASTDVWSNNQLYDPAIILDNSESGMKVLFGGGKFIRQRRIRYAKTETGYQICFELPSKIREQWEQKSALLGRLPLKEDGCWKIKDDGYWKKLWTYSDDGIDISLGCEKENWNSYHFVRIEISGEITPKRLHQNLCMFGLPAVFLPDGPEDLIVEAKARMEAIKLPYNSDEILYRGGGEMVHRTLPLKAKENGARAFMAFVNGGDIDKTAEVVTSIAKNGLLSAQERILRGIQGLGNNPDTLMRAGSANQVFTRILMKKHFDEKIKLDQFAVNGLVMVLLDLNLFERVPYSYVEDNIGVRNPHFREVQLAQKQSIRILNGKVKKQNKPGFHTLLETLNAGDHLLNESMFDWTVSPQYIKRFVVWNRDDKTAIIIKLKKNGIEQLNGKLLDELIQVSDRLEHSMLKENDK